MVIHNPYAKKRPRTDETLPSTSSVYRPSTSISNASNNTHASNTGTAVLRNTYQPSIRLVGTNVVSEQDCAFRMGVINDPSSERIIAVNNNQNATNQSSFSSNRVAPVSKHPTSSSVASSSRNLSINQANVVVDSGPPTTTPDFGQAMLSASAAHPIRKPSPNPYLKKQKQFHSGNASFVPQGSVANELRQQPPNGSVHAPPSAHRKPPPMPAANAASTTNVAPKKPPSMATMRPESWKPAPKLSPAAVQARTLQPPSQVNPSKPLTSVLSRQQSIPITEPTNPLAGLPKELMYSPADVKPPNDSYRMKLMNNARIKEPLRNGWTLYPHQKRALTRSLSMRRMILALEMGLGKTIIGAVWAKAFKETFEQLKIFVVCPVTLKDEWKRTAVEQVGLQVEDENDQKKRPKKSKSQDEENEEEDDGLRLRICSWAKVPTEVDSYVKHFVVCCDEAHSMQSTDAQRTKEILNLVKDKRYVPIRFCCCLFCVECHYLLENSANRFQMCWSTAVNRNANEKRQAIQLVSATQGGTTSTWSKSKSLRNTLLQRTAEEFWKGACLGCERVLQFGTAEGVGFARSLSHNQGRMLGRSSSVDQRHA